MLIPERTEAVLGRKPIVLPPIEFAFLLWLAQRRLARTPHGGAMSWREAKATEFLATYTTIDRAKNQVDRVRRSLKDGIGKDWFEQRVTRLNKLVDDALGLAASAYRLSRSGRRPNTRYGLPSDLTSIVIETERKRGGQHGK
ncbi:MAG: hypothetical protein FJX57_15905 [Alphaproteobacteria bacterium]|nr:hypothetical protein [Alphaproteobacteria bacterium]